MPKVRIMVDVDVTEKDPILGNSDEMSIDFPIAGTLTETMENKKQALGIIAAFNVLQALRYTQASTGFDDARVNMNIGKVEVDLAK
jgi:hypothetical protein